MTSPSKIKSAERVVARDAKFYDKRLQETLTDGQAYVPELLLAILKELEKLNNL